VSNIDTAGITMGNETNLRKAGKIKVKIN